MLTYDQITAAINAAGFADVNELSLMLATAKLLVKRNALTYAVGALQAQRTAAAQDTEAKIQDLQKQMTELDAQLTTHK